MKRSWAAVGLLFVASCSVDEIDLTGKACPCVDGWRCDTATNKCVEEGAGGASGGTAGASGAGGATGGAAGTGGSGCPGTTADCNGNPDDGCEVDLATTTQHCGKCGTDCATQGASGGFYCGNSFCRCGSGANCDPTLTAGNSCELSAGQCLCATLLCAPGEACKKESNKFVCSCNGGAACGLTEICCPGKGCATKC